MTGKKTKSGSRGGGSRASGDPEQVEAFRAKAREIGADDDGGSDAVMRKLAVQKRKDGTGKTGG